MDSEPPKDQPKEEEENKPKEEEENKPKLVQQDISQLINMQVAAQLQEMGFSKNVSEKACLFSNSILETCIEWINQHENDPDLEEPVIIQVNPDEIGKPQSTLSPEEAKKKAKELQEKMRKIHEQKQKELDEEHERNRVRQIKEMAKAKKLAEEQEARLFVERQKKKKLEEELELKRMREQLARDKQERFGKKYDPNSGLEADKQKVYTKEENVFYYLKTIKTLYPPFRASDTLYNCFNTLKVILNNILTKNDDKFKKVKMTNPNVQERIGKIQLAVKVLNELGFVEEGEFLVLKGNFDKNLFAKTVKYLEDEVAQLN